MFSYLRGTGHTFSDPQGGSKGLQGPPKTPDKKTEGTACTSGFIPLRLVMRTSLHAPTTNMLLESDR